MLWEMYQQTRISGAERSADRAESKADRYSDDIRRLGSRLDRLTLTCQAMWEILRDTQGICESDIENKMLEIDARDGSVDGKMATQLLSCSECGRPSNSKRSHCVICGGVVPRPHLFEG